MRRDSAAPGGARPPDDIAPPVEIAIDGRPGGDFLERAAAWQPKAQ
jgi:hypothetical protein